METIFCNMYIILCGPSATGKGIAMKPGQSLLNELGIRLSSDAITREALIRQLANSADSTPMEDGNPAFHSSLTIFSKEMAVFLGSNNTQLMSDLCDWFDCYEKWNYSTKHQGEDDVLGVWVNLIGGTTPELLQSSLPRDAFGSGLMSRIIVVYCPGRGKTVVVPFLTKEEEELRKNLIYDLEKISMLSGDFKLTKASMDRWADIRHHMDANPPFEDYRMEGYNGRRPHHTLKLSMIMSASRSGSKIIEPQDIDRALSILTEAEQHMLKAFSGVGKSRLSDTLVRVLSYIATVKETTDAKLLRQFYYDCDKEDLEKVLLALHKMGCVRINYNAPMGYKEIVYIRQITS